MAAERLAAQQKLEQERAAEMAALKARVDTAVSYGAVFVPCPKPILQDGTEQLVVYPGFAAPPSPFAQRVTLTKQVPAETKRSPTWGCIQNPSSLPLAQGFGSGASA